MERSTKEMKEILKELGITPFPGGMVSSTQAAHILTWRIKHEQQTEHEYNAGHIRRHIAAGTLKEAGRLHERFKLFDTKDIFALRLMPQRGAGAKMREAKKASTS